MAGAAREPQNALQETKAPVDESEIVIDLELDLFDFSRARVALVELSAALNNVLLDSIRKEREIASLRERQAVRRAWEAVDGRLSSTKQEKIDREVATEYLATREGQTEQLASEFSSEIRAALSAMKAEEPETAFVILATLLLRICSPTESGSSGLADMVRGWKDAERADRARAGSGRSREGRPARIDPTVRAAIIRAAEALWGAYPALKRSTIETARKLLAKFAGAPGPLGAVADLHPKTVARVLREHAAKGSSTKG